MARRGIALMFLAFVAWCATALADDVDIDFSQGQWYRACLEIDEETEIPFLLWLPQGDGDAVVRNGEEDIRVDFERFPPPANQNDATERFVLDFPHYDSRIEAERDLTNTFRGQWTKMRSNGEARMSFRASSIPDAHPLRRFDIDPADAIEVIPDGFLTVPREESGVDHFRLEFEESGPAIAEFRIGEMRNFDGGFPFNGIAPIQGTIKTPTGDYRFLSGIHTFFVGSGTGRGAYRVSVFDGAHAFYIEWNAQNFVEPYQGNFHSGNWWRETFTARRLGPDEEFELPDPFSEVALTSGDGTLNIEALDKPRYRGKPVIVQIFGTWCPNCHDETPVLRELYERYRDDGLEVLGLAYEVTGDDARSQRQVDRFKEKFGIDWEIVIAGTSDKAQASKTLPDISAVKSFPTTIWIGRDGKVRAIHSGFAGPATGDEHVELVREFEALTEEIVGRD